MFYFLTFLAFLAGFTLSYVVGLGELLIGPLMYFLMIGFYVLETMFCFIHSVFSGLPVFCLEVAAFVVVIPGKFLDFLTYCVVGLMSLDIPKLLSEFWMRYYSCPPPETFFFVSTFPQTRYCFLVNQLYGVVPIYSTFDKLLLCLIVIALLTAFYLYSGICFRTRLQEVLMKLLYPFTYKPLQNPENLRSKFNSLEFCKIKPTPGHTHAQSACTRTVASTFIDRLGPSVGLEPYYVQRSRNDERKNRKGSRVAFWTKDLSVDPVEFNPPEHSLLAMVDVDQYIDMPSFLCDNFKPLVIYTFQPSQVARTSDEYSYTFLKDNSVEYRVTGGGMYSHQVWNYSADNIMVYKTFFGIPFKAATYLIDRRMTSPDHELILLTPLSMWRGIFALAARFLLYGRSLLRLSVVHGSFLRLKVHSMDGFKVSTGKVGEYAQATVPIEIDDTCRTIAETSKYDFTLPQATSLAGGDKAAGAMLMHWNRSLVSGDLTGLLESNKPDVVCPVKESINLYHFDVPSYDPADKPLVVPFMSPLLGDCFVPANSHTNIKHGVIERVEKVRPELLVMTPFLFQVMQEFVSFLIPEPNVIDPVDQDFLYDQQSRPSQRRILETLLPSNNFTRVVDAFIKKETYGDVKAVRLISQICGNDKAAYSLYIYAFTEIVLKPQKWYAFGKTPQQIALRIAEVCSSAKHDVSNSDFSKFDGHGSNLMRELEALVLNRAFRPQYKEEVLQLHRHQYGLKAFVRTPDTSEVVSYDSAYARLSGSPETSSFNGVVNAFVTYLMARLSRPDGTSHSPQEAWNSLGCYGGDDGLTADVYAPNYLRAAKLIGQELTVEKIFKDQLGVKFLARVYSPYVWNGDTNTCCDLPRQLTKLHVTVQLGHGVTPIMKLLEKCRAYYLTDKATPILGPFVQKVRFLLNSEFEENPLTAPMRAWATNFSAESQYRNESADWMWEYAQTVMPTAEIRRFHAWLDKADSLAYMLTPPMLAEPIEAKPKSTMVINGDVVTGTPQEQVAPTWKSDKAAEFEQFKARKIAQGLWEERPNRIIVRSSTGLKHLKPPSPKRENPEKTPPKTYPDGKGKTPLEPNPSPPNYKAALLKLAKPAPLRKP